MKKLLIISSIILLIIVAIVFFVVAPKPATAAVLYIERGAVEVNEGDGWETAADELELSKGDHVKTGDGEATIVFWEGEIMHLEPNSEVKLDGISKSTVEVSQLAGETWNKITRLSGISEYTIETPTTVATVRGTEFMLNMDEIMVKDGEVEFGPINEPGKMMVKAGMHVMADMMQKEASQEDMARIESFPDKYVKILKRVRAREIRKHKTILGMMEERGMSEEELHQQLEEVDAGRESEDKLYQQMPGIMKPKAKRTYMITKEIKSILASMNR